MKVYSLTTTVEVTVRMMTDNVPSDAALRDLVRDMITSGVEEHLATVETLSITSLRTSAPTDG
jgi:hypothetical protein